MSMNLTVKEIIELDRSQCTLYRVAQKWEHSACWLL